MKTEDKIAEHLRKAQKNEKTGTLYAHMIINAEELNDKPRYDLVAEFGLSPSAVSDLSRAFSAAAVLRKLGYKLVRE